jgi:CRP/FNR family transcriptional regulator, anaerobic regulatory protein
MTVGLDCARCPVRERAACAALAPDERERLAKLGHHRRVARGETVFAAGDSNAVCATLTEGALKIVRYDRDGNERILSLIHPAGFVGEMFSPVAHHDIVALTESRLCVFSRPQYEAIVSDHPELTAALLRRAAEELLETRELIDLAGRKSAEARVAGLILAFARAASHSPCHPADRFTLPLSRGEMASLLGLTIETVSRQLGKLEAKGLIEREGARGLALRDPRALEALVD